MPAPDWLASLNRALDLLPRPRFQACGVAGFHAALFVSTGATLLAGRSPLVLAVLAAVCALSFVVYLRVRTWLAGRKSLVLMEHVWFALACCAAALRLMHVPAPEYLDIVCVGLSVFLAAGRLGCLLVGCCHGRPSSIGIAYTGTFVGHFANVRLFPVAAIELAGLLFIGFCGLAALPFAAPGTVAAWFLLSYSAMRFGLENLRGDRRPYFLELSQAQWMSLAQGAAAVWWLDARRPVAGHASIGAALLFILATAVLAHYIRSPRRRILTTQHVRETTGLADRDPCGEPFVHNTSRGVTVAVSTAGRGLPRARHISLALPDGRFDLQLLCDLAVRAFPCILPESAVAAAGVLHFAVPEEPGREAAPAGSLYAALYGVVVRRIQSTPERLPQEAPALPQASGMPVVPSPWYFAAASAGQSARRAPGEVDI